MQHDVHHNPLRRFRTDFPYIVVLQADVAVGYERLCAPLYLTRIDRVTARASPLVTFEGADFNVILQQIAAISTSGLRRPVGSLSAYHDDILYALDWLFTGI